MCMNVYYDRIKQTLIFFEKSILVYYVLGNVCILYSICGQLYEGFRFIVSASQTYFACVSLPIVSYMDKKSRRLCSNANFNLNLAALLRLAAILKLEEQAYFGWLVSGRLMTSLRLNQSAFGVGFVLPMLNICYSGSFLNSLYIIHLCKAPDRLSSKWLCRFDIFSL